MCCEAHVGRCAFHDTGITCSAKVSCATALPPAAALPRLRLSVCYWRGSVGLPDRQAVLLREPLPVGATPPLPSYPSFVQAERVIVEPTNRQPGGSSTFSKTACHHASARLPPGATKIDETTIDCLGAADFAAFTVWRDPTTKAQIGACEYFMSEAPPSQQYLGSDATYVGRVSVAMGDPPSNITADAWHGFLDTARGPQEITAYVNPTDATQLYKLVWAQATLAEEFPPESWTRPAPRCEATTSRSATVASESNFLHPLSPAFSP